MEIISDNLRDIMLVFVIILPTEKNSFCFCFFMFQPSSEEIQQSISPGNAIIDIRMCLFNSTFPQPNRCAMSPPVKLWLSHYCSCLQHNMLPLFLTFRKWIKM